FSRDWSSDVCSSDLEGEVADGVLPAPAGQGPPVPLVLDEPDQIPPDALAVGRIAVGGGEPERASPAAGEGGGADHAPVRRAQQRSEERRGGKRGRRA